MKILLKLSILSILAFSINIAHAQITQVGSGSYTKSFPGVDVAGRNAYPSGSPQISGKALGKPVPSNDWWSKLVKENHADNLFNYPYTLKTTNKGLVISYIPQGVIDDLLPVTVGVSGLSVTNATVSDYSDWTVSMNWNDGSHNFEATAGIGMPFLYFTKKSSDVAQIEITSGTATIKQEMLIIEKAKNGASFVAYAPTGSTWSKDGNTYTSTLNGKDYWSMAFIPLTASNVEAVANEYKKYAYVFPKNTTVAWNYNEATSAVRTDFTVETDVKEGSATNMLLGLLPHHWANLASDSPQPTGYVYSSIRGQLKTLAGNKFSVENKFHGILPTLPYVDNYSEGFSPSVLAEKISAIQNDELSTWTDSYNDGQVVNRLIQAARVAAEMNNTAALNKLLATVKDRLENWLRADNGEVAFLFYYNSTWSALLGYPAGHGQDSNLNDHHFHWGYFIHAAAFVEQYEPGWASQWGDMVNLLVRDAASTDRNDTMFPFLRNFSPYAGHSWANGFATFPQGNDQESTSESMQFNSSLIHWGSITNNKAIRDLGIYLYTTEQTAIEEYWFDIHDRNFPPTQQYSLVSRVWGNNFDNGTFWTNDIAASYGIELYPIHGGSLYLGHHPEYASKLWNEIKTNTGIMNNEVNANLWHDVMWKYLAFTDAAKAIELMDSYPNRELKFGITDVQTYHWLHAMNALGQVDASITANHPLAVAFNKDGDKTYTAQNYSNQELTVNFSDGYQLKVPPHKLLTSKDASVAGTISSSFSQAYVGGSVQLKVVVTEGTPSKVEFMDGSTSLGTVSSAPYQLTANNLAVGKHNFYARIFEDDAFNTTNAVEVVVGDVVPFNGTPWNIPGTIEAGKYDIYEGGKGQNITYFDSSSNNQGDYRMDEAVDVAYDNAEGATIGWINTGEWVEYTVNVEQSGLYSFDFRYASGNANGGGPFNLKLDGDDISGNILVPSTSSTVWTNWATKTVSDIPLTEGKHTLRIAFGFGEFNLGRMTFTRTGDLAYSVPKANAGGNVKVLLPQTSTTLDASGSSESGGKALSYLWEQIYGPSVVTFSSTSTDKPTINGLVEGVYKLKLKVTNSESRSAYDEILVIATSTQNIAPTISLTSPSNNSTFAQGKTITISANASDFDGTIAKVEFYQGDVLIGTKTVVPYTMDWKPEPGKYVISAKATDSEGGIAISQKANIECVAVMVCGGTSKDAQQGTFTDGYNYTFETVGNTVTISTQLLDNKEGVIAYLWTESPFSEKSMQDIGNKTFSTTATGEKGTTISVGVKFAFAGGMAVTKYLSYTIGDNCGTISIENDKIDSETYVYPNPVIDVLNIRASNDQNKLILFDLFGNKIVEKQVSSNDILNMSNLPTGIYFVQIENTNGFFSHKIIKK